MFNIQCGKCILFIQFSLLLKISNFPKRKKLLVLMTFQVSSTPRLVKCRLELTQTIVFYTDSAHPVGFAVAWSCIPQTGYFF